MTGIFSSLHAGNECLVLDEKADITKNGKVVRQCGFPDVITVGSVTDSDGVLTGSLPDGDIDLKYTSYVDEKLYDLISDTWNGYRIQFYVPRIKFQNKISQGPEIKYFSDKLIVFATSLLPVNDRVELNKKYSVVLNGKKIYYTKEIDDEMIGYKQMTALIIADTDRWCAISIIYHPSMRIAARKIAFSLQAFKE